LRFDKLQEELKRQFQKNAELHRDNMEQHQTTQGGIVNMEEKALAI
jgi:hypothetical protein